MTDDYSPFPSAELEAIAAECDACLPFLREGLLRERVIARAKTCRNAIASYAALQMRCLEDETVKRLRFSGQLEAAD